MFEITMFSSRDPFGVSPAIETGASSAQRGKLAPRGTKKKGSPVGADEPVLVCAGL